MFHTLILVGRLGRDPEHRTTASGSSVCNFSVASDRKYTGQDGNLVTETIWFRVSVWGKQADACATYPRKGAMVLIEGRLIPDPSTGSPRVWQGQNGAGASFEVSASTVRFLTKAEAQAMAGGASAADEEVPF